MLTFIMTYWNELLIAISSVVSGASAVAALTPTTKDDTVWNKVKKGIDVLALNVGNAKTA